MSFQKIQGSQNPSPFIQKLQEILKNTQNEQIIRFNDSEKQIQITNKKQLQKILCRYFRHAKYESFIRQLNWYGFYKVNNHSLHCYKHSNLERGLSLLTIKSRRTNQIKRPRNASRRQERPVEDRIQPQVLPDTADRNTSIPSTTETSHGVPFYNQNIVYSNGIIPCMNADVSGVSSNNYMPYNWVNWNAYGNIKQFYPIYFVQQQQ